jgi:HSF-type DNA-binding
LLAQAHDQNYDSIISWKYHGRAFEVHEPERFATDVMPYFFQQTKYSSFVRQLQMYGIQRVRCSDHPDDGAYYHANFLRGKPSLLRKIKRRYKVSEKLVANPSPDFSSMPIADHEEVNSVISPKASHLAEHQSITSYMELPPSDCLSHPVTQWSGKIQPLCTWNESQNNQRQPPILFSDWETNRGNHSVSSMIKSGSRHRSVSKKTTTLLPRQPSVYFGLSQYVNQSCPAPINCDQKLSILEPHNETLLSVQKRSFKSYTLDFSDRDSRRGVESKTCNDDLSTFGSYKDIVCKIGQDVLSLKVNCTSSSSSVNSDCTKALLDDALWWDASLESEFDLSHPIWDIDVENFYLED